MVCVVVQELADWRGLTKEALSAAWEHEVSEVVFNTGTKVLFFSLYNLHLLEITSLQVLGVGNGGDCRLKSVFFLF